MIRLVKIISNRLDETRDFSPARLGYCEIRFEPVEDKFAFSYNL